ncbi:hypothetical protein ACVWYS_003411 [Arthrobacter sp. TE12231]
MQSQLPNSKLFVVQLIIMTTLVAYFVGWIFWAP